jgi:hypothetical protein
MKSERAARLGSVLHTLASQSPAGRAQLMQQRAKGMIDARIVGQTVVGRVPVEALSQISELSSLRSLRPTMAMRRVGLTHHPR